MRAHASLATVFLLAMTRVAAVGNGISNTAEAPRHESARVLVGDGGRLRVEVMDPAAPVPYYHGNRFSPVANVLRATLDGRDFLFSPVAHDATMENAGLAMEFDLKEWAGGGPPGFATAAEGGPFLKVGVGVLRKTVGEYGFYKSYETIAYAPTEAEWEASGARFRQTCGPVEGLGYRLDAEIRVKTTRLEIAYRLENTGSKSFATEQYAHNFFSFVGAPDGPGYELEFSRGFTFDPGKLALDFADAIPARKAVNATVVLAPIAEGDVVEESVVVRHPALGMSLRATVSRPTHHVTIHASAAYLCPEQFVRIHLLPGEAATWVRAYEFMIEATKAR